MSDQKPIHTLDKTGLSEDQLFKAKLDAFQYANEKKAELEIFWSKGYSSRIRAEESDEKIDYYIEFTINF